MTQIDGEIIEPKQVKFTPKNTTGSLTHLAQAETNLEEDVKKPKSNKNTKRYSYFKCPKCHFKDFVSMDTKSRISNETLHDIHRKSHPDHKLQYSNEGLS